MPPKAGIQQFLWPLQDSPSTWHIGHSRIPLPQACVCAPTLTLWKPSTSPLPRRCLRPRFVDWDV